MYIYLESLNIDEFNGICGFHGFNVNENYQGVKLGEKKSCDIATQNGEGLK